MSSSMLHVFPKPESLHEFEDDLTNRTALVLFWGELLVIAITAVFGGFFIAADPTPRVVTVINLGLMLEIASFILLLRGRLFPSKFIFILAMWTTLSYASWMTGGVTSPTIGGLTLVIVLGAIFFGWKGALLASALNLATISGLMLLENLGLLSSAGSQLAQGLTAFTALAFALTTTALLAFFDRILVSAMQTAQQAEAALDVERDRLGLAVKAAQMGFWDLAPGSGELVIDSRWSALLGYEAVAQILPRAEWETHIHPHDLGDVLSKLNTALSGEGVLEVEFRHRMADGDWRWVMSRGRVVDDPLNGGGRKMIGVHTDIHDRKQAAEAIAAHQQELESVLRHAPIVLWRVDREGFFTLAKGYGLRTFGLPADGLLGKHHSELGIISPDWEQLVIRSLAGEKLEGSFAIGASSFSVRSKPFYGVDGERAGAIGVVADVSEQKRNEKSLKEAYQELEQIHEALQTSQKQLIQQARLAAVGQLAAGIAHDFNNALLPITLYVEMLLNDPGLEPEMRERLETILSQAQRAASLTQQILDFGRKSLLVPEPMDLQPFLERFLRMLDRTLPENIHIALTTADQNHTICADENRIEQVMMNLALNARDAMPSGGSLTFHLDQEVLEAPHARHPQIDPGCWVRLDVRDTGEGIPQDLLNQVFEPFFTTKPIGSGSGLGLAQVYGIVKQHGGHVFVDSEEGTGACFSLWFPCIEGCVQVQPSSPVKIEASGEGERILVVEDDDATGAALVDVLSLMSYDVIQAENGATALSLYQPGHIDLVMSDMGMPDMSGVELFHALRKRDPDLRMVIVTGYPLGDEQQELMGLGLCGWVQKPLDLQRVRQVVTRALQKDPAVSSSLL